MSLKFIIIIFLSFITIAFLSMCNSDVGPNANIVFPDKNVSFQGQVLPFLMIKCSFQGCHSSNNMAGGIKLVDYYSLMAENATLAQPKDTVNSRLIILMDLRQPHNPQFGTAYFTDNEKKGIRRWILEGALAN